MKSKMPHALFRSGFRFPTSCDDLRLVKPVQQEKAERSDDNFGTRCGDQRMAGNAMVQVVCLTLCQDAGLSVGLQP